MSKHTPGPWFTGIWGDEIGDIRAGDPDGANLHVAACEGRSRGANAANAAFIVRACNAHEELLGACKAFMVAWEKSLQLEKTDVALKLAKEAIAKAEGKE